MDEQNTIDSPKKNNTAKMAVVAVVVVLLVIVAVMGFQAMNGNKAVSDTSIRPERMGTMMKASLYKDGTYTQIGDYVSPGGPETIEVTVTLDNGKISDVEFVGQATRPISKEKQADFAANYKPMVIGKSIDEVNLSKVSGSSLTPKGFNDALEKIKTEAKS